MAGTPEVGGAAGKPASAESVDGTPPGHPAAPAQGQTCARSFPRAWSWDSRWRGAAAPGWPQRATDQTPPSAPCGPAQPSPRSASEPETHMRQERGASRVGPEHQPRGPDADWVCPPEGQSEITWGVPCSEHRMSVRPPLRPCRSGQRVRPPGRTRSTLPFLELSGERSGGAHTCVC